MVSAVHTRSSLNANADQKRQRKQKTPKGYEISVPKRSEVERDLKKLARSGRPKKQD